jgi:hypothetical protein
VRGRRDDEKLPQTARNEAKAKSEMMESGKRQVVATIVLEGERLLNLARASGNTVIAGLIQAVVEEARATLTGRPSNPPGSDQDGEPSSIVQLKAREKPRRLH